MPLSILISSVNYNGQIGDITFFPSTGGTINIGSQTIPYTYTTDYPYGTYSIYFSLYIPHNINITINYLPLM